MSEIRVEPYNIPAADLGPENPLPYFRNIADDNPIDAEANNINEEDQVGLGWATGSRVLPYRMQDNYNRDRKPRDFFSVVLENEFLKVRVLPEVGGMVTSIIHKPLNKELIECNPVFQPGNIALRNAWVSGGIEWNTAQIGHHYLTCSPVHTAIIDMPNGEKALRMFAWERVKAFPYSIDLYLPSGSPLLYARVRLVNPHDYEMPMYWWTNIGVQEEEDRRVIAPTDSAFHGLKVTDIPVIDGVDATYCTRMHRAYDLFFRIPKDQRPYEAIISKDGTGFVHTSTPRLRYRKMFAWGMDQGQRRWQSYLSVPGHAFQEIQAGLAPTQNHSIAMPANTEWTWTEAMGYIETDPAKAHSASYKEAYTEVGRVLDTLATVDQVNKIDADLAAVSKNAPSEVIFKGLGWGALEKKLEAQKHLKELIPAGFAFDESDLNEEQAPWIELLENGAMPCRDPQQEPGHYMIQPEWMKLLEESIASGKADNYLSYIHLGIMKIEAHDDAGAKEAFEQSIARQPNAWAYRNLAAMEARIGNIEPAIELYRKAWETGPKIDALAIEFAGLLLKLEKYGELKNFIVSLSEDIKSHERIRMIRAKLAVMEERYDDVEKLLSEEFATIREGEVSLTDLWFDMHASRIAKEEKIPMDDELRARVRREFTPPASIDFRMFSEEKDKYVAPQAKD